MAPANTFTENFTTNTYENTGATTAKWDYTVNHQLVLSNANQFAETTGVIDWGGGVRSIDYDNTNSIWLIGGDGGKINKYDGSFFTNLTTKLVNFGTSSVAAVKANGTYWLVGGDGPSLNKWDGLNTWTDIKAGLVNFTGNIRAIAWKIATPSYWLIGGTSASINKYDGTTFTDLSASLKSSGNFASTNDIRAIGWNGSYWLIVGTGGRICNYDGASTWTDLSASLSTAWSGTYDVYSLDWNGTKWLIGGGAGKIASCNGTTCTNITGSYTINTVWSIKWNPVNSYWLIGGSNGTSTSLVTYDGTTFYQQPNMTGTFDVDPIWAIGVNSTSGLNILGGSNGRLMSRLGGVATQTNTDLGTSIKDFGYYNIKAAAYNTAGGYWLIGGDQGSLNKYDGTTFTDLQTSLGWRGSGASVLSIAYNSTGG